MIHTHTSYFTCNQQPSSNGFPLSYSLLLLQVGTAHFLPPNLHNMGERRQSIHPTEKRYESERDAGITQWNNNNEHSGNNNLLPQQTNQMDRSPGIVDFISDKGNDKSQRKKSSSHLPYNTIANQTTTPSLLRPVCPCVWCYFWGKLVCCRLGLCLCVFPESSSSFSIISTHPGFEEGRDTRDDWEEEAIILCDPFSG